MKKRITVFTALLLMVSMLCGTMIFADEEQSKLKVKIVSSDTSIYEDCSGSFEVALDGLEEGQTVEYEWYVSTKAVVPNHSNDVNGWYPMHDTYSWADGTDSQKLTITVPKGFAAKYSGDNVLLFRCKVSVSGTDYYSGIISPEIILNPYEDALEFDDEYQVPDIGGNRSVEEINPTDYYMVKFAAKALPERFSYEGYTVKAGIRVNGESVVLSDTDYARLERGFDKGLYLITEELYLYRDGLKVATARKELALTVDESCEHYWQKIWDSASCAEDGKALYKCIYCGAVKEEDSAATGEHDWHVIENRKCSLAGEGKIVSICSTCGEMTEEIVDHVFEEVLEYRFGSDPISYLKCIHCPYVKGAKVEDYTECEHEWAEVQESFVAPTCYENGKRVFACSKCNETKEVEVLASEAYHVPGEWIDDSEGNCSVSGERHIVCEHCNETMITEILPADHRWELSEVTYPSCTENGNILWVCSRCGDTKNVAVSLEGHNIAHVDKIEGNCIIENVNDHFECSECGSVFADAAGQNPLEHSEVYTGCDFENHIEGSVYAFDGNSHYSLCACFEKLNEERHKFSNGVCKVCGYVKGSMEEIKFSFVDRLCSKLGISEIVLLMIFAVITVLLLILTLVFLILFLRGKNKGKKKKKSSEEQAIDELNVENTNETLYDEIMDESIIDVEDAVLIDWDDDPDDNSSDENITDFSNLEDL